MSTSSGLMPAARKLSSSFCLGSKNLRCFSVELVANARLDHYGLFARADYDGIGAQHNLIQFVGRRPLLPHRLRNHAEHGAAILQMGAIRQDGEIERPRA